MPKTRHKVLSRGDFDRIMRLIKKHEVKWCDNHSERPYTWMSSASGKMVFWCDECADAAD